MEKWDLYNEKRELIGTDHIRGNKIPDNAYHLVVHVWIKNKNEKFLISQRAENRATFPLMWESVGGSVLKGETSLQGAIREVREEVGINLKESEGNIIFSKLRRPVEYDDFNSILDVWFFKYDGDILLSKATTDEVITTKWLTLKEIKKLFNQKLFVPSQSYILDLYP